MKKQMSQTLPCGITVSGEVYALAQLSARFQIEARRWFLNDSESLAVWIEGDEQKIKTYFRNRRSDYNRDLNSGKNKLANVEKEWQL